MILLYCRHIRLLIFLHFHYSNTKAKRAVFTLFASIFLYKKENTANTRAVLRGNDCAGNCNKCNYGNNPAVGNNTARSCIRCAGTRANATFILRNQNSASRYRM